MSRPSEVVVLAEDKRQQRFVWRYLEHSRYRWWQVRELSLPAGRGSGEQYVREKYATEVSAYRHRATRAQTALIVVIDADTQKVQDRARQLAEALRKAGMEDRRAGEAIVHLIPKRNIETWVLYLSGRDVSEGADYRNASGIDDTIRAAAVEFLKWSRDGTQVPERCLPYLKQGLREVNRLTVPSSPPRRS